MVFTYSIPPGMEPVVGGRVLVPFRQQRMSGIVVELHDRPLQVKTKKVIEALDLAPVLDEHLLKLGKWIADYYLAPVGEVFRTMLPLSAEFKRSVAYRITDEGRAALTRVAASLGQINLGHFLPDYTAYEELLDIFKAFTPIPILLEGERGYAFTVEDLRREVHGRGLSALLLSNPCNPTGKLVQGDELGRRAARSVLCRVRDHSGDP